MIDQWVLFKKLPLIQLPEHLEATLVAMVCAEVRKGQYDPNWPEFTDDFDFFDANDVIDA